MTKEVVAMVVVARVVAGTVVVARCGVRSSTVVRDLRENKKLRTEGPGGEVTSKAVCSTVQIYIYIQLLKISTVSSLQ